MRISVLGFVFLFLFAIHCKSTAIDVTGSQVQCALGYYDIDQNSDNGCEYACTFISNQDLPESKAPFVDQNCDGVDGIAEQSIFVDAQTGSDLNVGGMQDPMKTIQGALYKAKRTNKFSILISKGIYEESVQLSNGISLYGGYSKHDGWQRAAAFETRLQPTESGRKLDAVIKGQEILMPTTLGMLHLHALAQHGTITRGLSCQTCPALILDQTEITTDVDHPNFYGVFLSDSMGAVVKNCKMYVHSDAIQHQAICSNLTLATEDCLVENIHKEALP